MTDKAYFSDNTRRDGVHFWETEYAFVAGITPPAVQVRLEVAIS